MVFLMISIVLAFVGIVVYSYMLDKREWNNGICRETGMPWVCFDADSSGARGYKSGDQVCWISWNFDKFF